MAKFNIDGDYTCPGGFISIWIQILQENKRTKGSIRVLLTARQYQDHFSSSLRLPSLDMPRIQRVLEDHRRLQESSPALSILIL
jgi:hypothetical protein